jgi:hypothetical protein
VASQTLVDARDALQRAGFAAMVWDRQGRIVGVTDALLMIYGSGAERPRVPLGAHMFSEEWVSLQAASPGGTTLESQRKLFAELAPALLVDLDVDTLRAMVDPQLHDLLDGLEPSPGVVWSIRIDANFGSRALTSRCSHARPPSTCKVSPRQPCTTSGRTSSTFPPATSRCWSPCPSSSAPTSNACKSPSPGTTPTGAGTPSPPSQNKSTHPSSEPSSPTRSFAYATSTTSTAGKPPPQSSTSTADPPASSPPACWKPSPSPSAPSAPPGGLHLAA